MTGIPQRLKGGHRRMQAKETIQIDSALAAPWTRNRDAGAHGIVSLLAMRNHNVQSIGCSALKQHHQTLFPRSHTSSLRRVDRAGQKAGNYAGSHYGQSAALQKYSASNRHTLSP